MAGSAGYTIVVPVFGNEASLSDLLERLALLAERLDEPLEVMFIVDGSPDRCATLLEGSLPAQPFSSSLILHSRNFGSFATIRTGMEHASGRFVGVMAADLQEPSALTLEFFRCLAADEADVVVGVRRKRSDPFLSALAARLFWGFYRHLVQREMPVGGIDVFACNDAFRRRLLSLGESRSSLVAQAVWLGFRRSEVEYERAPRDPAHGRSGWTLRKKLSYLSDSIFAFTDLPIRLLLAAGCIGVAASVGIAAVVAAARAAGAIDVPGYTATILVITFFAALNLAGLGIVGAYVWRAYENTKGRPGAVVMSEYRFEARERA